jgi:hypothetical protein
MKLCTAVGEMWRRPVRLAAAKAVMLVAACAAGDPSSTGIGASPTVETLIGDAACDADSQCHTIGVGAKGCGGPQRYLAWSSLRTNGAILHEAVEKEASAARARAEASGAMSNCAIVVDPGAFCSAIDATGGPPEVGRPQTARTCRLRHSGSVGDTKIR